MNGLDWLKQSLSFVIDHCIEAYMRSFSLIAFGFYVLFGAFFFFAYFGTIL